MKEPFEPVGSWSVVFEAQPESTLRDTVAQTARHVADAVGILAGYRLLKPSVVASSHWAYADSEKGLSGPGRERRVAVHSSDPAELRRAIDSLTDSVFVPVDFSVWGPTALVMPDRVEVWQEAVLDLSGTSASSCIITLTTYSDVWLEFDLAGRRQLALQELNAPRLEAAVREIAALPGAELGDGDLTPYAVVAGTHISNHRSHRHRDPSADKP